MINYQDVVTLYSVNPGSYGNDKVISDSKDVNAIFVQDIGYLHNAYQDMREADAIAWLDPEDTFISGLNYKLEGIYLSITLYGTTTWYRITNTTTNRDHLLSNQIDNVEVLLIKTDALPGVS